MPLRRLRNFNSIKVQLELAYQCKTCQKWHDFNSIKVQLEPISSFRRLISAVFQFHKGTIRTVNDVIARSKKGNFNSIKVQLELSGSVESLLENMISIP